MIMKEKGQILFSFVPVYDKQTFNLGKVVGPS